MHVWRGIMSSLATSLLIFILISSSSLALDNCKSVFTKEIRIPKGRHPFKLNGELKIFDSNTLISITPEISGCTLENFHPHFGTDFYDRDPVHVLGNGKLVIVPPYKPSEFQVLKFHNCSFYASNFISNDRTYSEKFKYSKEDQLESVVFYNDTFDVFDSYQSTCMPCRYNDMGKQLPVEFLLTKEPTGQDPTSDIQHHGFSLDLIESDFGVKNGYFYVFKYLNKTSALRILDSQFRVVKQRLFPAKIEAQSVSYGSITVCYTKNICNENRQYCESAECHLLNADLNSIAKVKLHQVSNDTDTQIQTQLRVKNLIGGGAMVAMRFRWRPYSTYPLQTGIFLQRIRSDGSVDEPIEFDRGNNYSVIMHDFTFDNGEYCLVAFNSHFLNKDSFSIIKCLNTSLAV